MALFHCTGNPVPNCRAIVSGDSEAEVKDALRRIIINDCRGKLGYIINRILEDMTNLTFVEPNPELVHRLNEIEIELRRMAKRHQVIIRGDQ